MLTMLSFVACASVTPLLAPTALAYIGSQTPFVTTPIWVMLAIATGIDLFVGAHAALIQTGNRVSHLPAFVITALVNLVRVATWPGRTELRASGQRDCESSLDQRLVASA